MKPLPNPPLTRLSQHYCFPLCLCLPGAPAWRQTGTGAFVLRKLCAAGLLCNIIIEYRNLVYYIYKIFSEINPNSNLHYLKMKPSIHPRVKVCCISSIEEASAAIESGASALGLVSKMPSGPGVIPDDAIIKIVKTIPPGVASFLLTSEVKADKIISQQKMLNANTLQLVDEIETNEYEIIRTALPGIAIVQVIHVIDELSLNQSVKVSKYVDAILLDSGNPNLAIKELGGTGRVHNWEISRKIREAIDIPVYLAGGLNSSNVRKAIETVKPFGVDLCSGVRTAGVLDKEKLRAFFANVFSFYN